MPVPIIAAAAAAAAARLAAKKVGQAAGKQVVKATLGKQSAAKYAAQKAAANTKTIAASSRNAKKAAETRAALKSAKSKPPLAEPSKASVKVLPRKTAPKTDLSNRGNKLSPGSKSDRAANEYIKKAESRWQGEYLTTQTGLRGPVDKSVRGPSKKKLTRETSMLKEANKKPPIKINSQRNLKAK